VPKKRLFNNPHVFFVQARIDVHEVASILLLCLTFHRSQTSAKFTGVPHGFPKTGFNVDLPE
jgi:hypothetical protein